MRAEINSIFPDGLDLILSGRLAVSKKTHREFSKHCRAMRTCVSNEKRGDKGKKNFLIDLACLLINDASNDEGGKDDHKFKDLMGLMTDRIIEDEEDNDYDFLSTYKKDSKQGKLYYGF